MKSKRLVEYNCTTLLIVNAFLDSRSDMPFRRIRACLASMHNCKRKTQRVEQWKDHQDSSVLKKEHIDRLRYNRLCTKCDINMVIVIIVGVSSRNPSGQFSIWKCCVEQHFLVGVTFFLTFALNPGDPSRAPRFLKPSYWLLT